MRGRHVFMQSLVAHGVERLFGNPGTTESPLIDSLPEYPSIKYVTALHEGVAVGAASYYAQASGKTAVVNLHVAPGLGNAVGMIYGALKANTPMIVTAGAQDTRMRLRNPLLGHDLASIAAPVVKWSVQVERADEIGPIMQRAFKVANDAPAGPVFVALPIDVLGQETDVPATVAGKRWVAPPADAAGVAALAALLASAKRPAIVAGDDVARAGATAELVALAEACGAGVWVEGLRHHAVFPTGHGNFRGAVAFDAAAIRQGFGDADCVLLAGGPFFEDVWFAPGAPFPTGATVAQIEESQERLAFNYPLDAGVVGGLKPTLKALAEALAAGPAAQRGAAAERNAGWRKMKDGETAAYEQRRQKAWARLPMSMARCMAELRAGSPKDVVVVDESITANLDLARAFDFAAPGDYFSGRGGGIGQGLAGALGAKVAMPGRPVLCVSGDGSAMYSIQALWTAAHCKLDIVFVILANREYRVLKHNLDIWRTRFSEPSNRGYPHMDLGGPALGFVEMALGMGVSGERVSKPDDLRGAVQRAFAAGGPRLIEVEIEGKR